MADAIIEKARELFEGQIVCFSIHACAATAFLVGYITSNVYWTLYVGLGGTVITFLIVVPPWPIYNENPVQWLPAKGRGSADYDIVVDGQRVTS
ncbi:hypothetical protein LTR66_005856 [Elasticomyces elasticus]|nr:hypothetical protein LTR28_005400 [Elasticomyces elasticus]KAK4984076.1 hypothetical protein LTR50_006818 [Elasticomyces elasticus]KAK4994034.1 hypothetical protein LTR66_005856 [Elasticomyces elasticus]